MNRGVAGTVRFAHSGLPLGEFRHLPRLFRRPGNMILLVMIRLVNSALLVISIFYSGGLKISAPSGPAEVPANSPAIVIGFVGGFIKHNDPVHIEVQMAARLRKEYGSSVVVDTFENRNGDKAYQEILTVLDANHDGTLSSEEKRNARVILYGHSWGASETIALARRLEKVGIPVLLTVQVDSVGKLGENDEVIPSNVAQAVNFYESDGFLHGEPQIRAADASRTQIVGNYRFSYAASPYNCTNFPWYARIFMRAHTQIECDSKVWNQVESLIRAHLPATTKVASAE